MKTLIILAFCSHFMLAAGAQNPAINISSPDSAKKIQIVESSCGECQFHMTTVCEKTHCLL